MPRSPSDATRFTATGPYISNKPLSSPSISAVPGSTSTPTSTKPPTIGARLNFETTIPRNETPQQKIARLRAAAALAKRGKETSFDRTVRVGRLWADRAHRFTALGLIGLTVLSGAVATAGITDMLLHNRRRRNEWLAEKQAETARELAIAREAEVRGTASEDQMLLINRERAADEAAAAKKNRPGMFKRATGWIFGGLAEEEKKGGRLGSGTPQKQAFAPEPTHENATLQAVEDRSDTTRRQSEAFHAVLTPAGGPLDQQAQVALDSASKSTQSWVSWVTRR